MKADDKNMEYQILEAAEKLFLEQGFAKTTTGQIAKLAGCNQALVHYYYRTKDNLFDKIFEEKIKLVVTNLMTVNKSDISIEERIPQMISMHFDFLKQNPNLLMFVLNEITSNPERVHFLVNKLQNYPKSVLDTLDTDLKKEIEKGNIRPITSTDLLLTIVSLNIAPFIILPTLQKALSLPDTAFQDLLEHRKQEVIDTVLARLKK